MKKTLLLFSFFAVMISAAGQVNRFGVPVIRNYATQLTGGNEQNWCITKDKWGNVYFGNQDKGVIRYDGTKWLQIKIGNNPRIYSLESDSAGIVYVGAAFEFGYIRPDLKGRPEYVSLSSRLESKSEIICITNIVTDNDRVLFLGPDFIYSYYTSSDSLSKTDLKEYGFKEALRLIKIDGKLILSENFKGLFELNGEKVVPLPGGDFFSNKICTVILPYDGSTMLVATFYDGIYLYDYRTGAVNSRFIDPRVNDKLKAVMVYAGAKLGGERYALGTTQEQGILVFDRTGTLIQKLDNTESDLQDITIYSMFCDPGNNSELWIATQGFISKAYLNLPVTQFGKKQGIDAGLNGICGMNGSIYLSTDAGVLKSFVTDKNTLSFKGVPGADGQVFPLIRFKNTSDEFIIAGSIDGLLQISEKGVTRIGDRLKNLPAGQSGKYRSKRLLQSVADPSLVYVGNDAGGIRMIRYDGKDWTYVKSVRNIPGQIYGMLEDRDGKTLWFITEDQNGLYNIKENDTIPVKYGPEKGLRNLDINSIHYIGDNIYITTTSGLYRYDKINDLFTEDNSITGDFSEGKNSTWLFTDTDDDLWYSGSDARNFERIFRQTGDLVTSSGGFLKLLPDVPLMDYMSADNNIFLIKSKYLYVIRKSEIKPDSTMVSPYFVRITAGKDSIVTDGPFVMDKGGRRIPVHTISSSQIPEFSYDMNEISFECTTPYYTEELLTEYSCKLEGFDREWTSPEGISYGNTMEAQYFRKEYSNLPYGTYTFRLRTTTLDGLGGRELSYRFTILKPWYATSWAVIVFIMVTFGVIYLIIKAYTRKLKNENLRLEGIVAERTAVVVKQKEELESSIHYASRIQMALLPSEAILTENIRNYFILFKPRDIVSGDFYWMTKKDERLYIVAADCTGHGVPGAFMSLLGMSFLDEIIDKDKTLRADQILRQLRLHVTESLKQVGNDDEAKDGMDIALLVVDFGTRKIEFSGAYNPCYRVRKMTAAEVSKNGSSEVENDGSMSNGKYVLDTIYASKMPIGISSKMNEDFTLHQWTLEKGISYYLFSDGYLDQFGGPDGRKFMKKNFKRLILNIQDYPMAKQKELLDNNMKEWMGNSPQIDDILVMGIRTE